MASLHLSVTIIILLFIERSSSAQFVISSIKQETSSDSKRYAIENSFEKNTYKLKVLLESLTDYFISEVSGYFNPS